ncbi:MAG: recombinase family protein [Maritimibacter sp.]|uniref:recombinase family protein n=1 Tax=Maritimibacter sp. TaxID=2003363 RepID=UPI001D26731C|nr:recombinase family protein [Maritimibacter sp.]MBL6427753.1 recombinase family protein [Maritimibacter sp.]
MRKETEKQERFGKHSLKRAVGYVRVSTAQQGKNGMSLELQKEAISTYTSRAGYDLIEIFEDVSSGKGDTSFYKRKGLKAALALAKAQDAILVVWDWSRLSRSSGIEKQIIASFGDISRVVSAKEKNTLSEASEAAAHVHNERFAEELSKRTKAGMAKKREQGMTFGNSEIKTVAQPLGSAANAAAADRLVREIAAVLRAHEDPFGCYLRDVVEVLKQKGLRTRRNKEWTVERARPLVKKARQLLKKETADTSDGDISYADDERYGAF